MPLFPRATQRRAAHTAYAALVQLARTPALYKECGIPDTLDGRFDAIILHLFLFQRRLRETHDARAGAFGRMVSEAFIADMDRSIREMGVGDTGVARRVKQMASALLGRISAYEDAWGDENAFREALSRNLYRGTAPSPAEVDALMACLRANGAMLHACTIDALYQGKLQATASSCAGAASSATVAA